MGRVFFFTRPPGDGCLLAALGTGTQSTPGVMPQTCEGGEPQDAAGTTLSPHMAAAGWQNEVFWDITAC